ncbi:WbqC family protein [Ekhidna sp.]|uniref:WbqC family protein n=1 Tax=Ekhidna sp. TaxID=2608089 RepID=UPI003C7B2069
MRLAIMQPYLFPYIGYFQLIESSDLFIFLTDSNFIKQGWINRNQLLLNGHPTFFTVPLSKASSNKKINETKIHTHLFEKWKNGFLKSIKQSYAKSKNFDSFYPELNSFFDTNFHTIDKMAIASIKFSANFLGLKATFKESDFYDSSIKGSERVIHICKEESATDYINLPGGMELYSKKSFNNEGIELHFIESLNFNYRQISKDFHPNLSILDLLFNCSEGELNEFLKNYQLT